MLTLYPLWQSDWKSIMIHPDSLLQMHPDIQNSVRLRGTLNHVAGVKLCTNWDNNSYAELRKEK